MPVYEYDCRACGQFSQSRLMALSAAPAPCPSCGGQAPRVLSAAAVARGRGPGRRMRGQPEPALVKSDREPPKPKMTAAPGGRPWMIGH